MRARIKNEVAASTAAFRKEVFTSIPHKNAEIFYFKGVLSLFCEPTTTGAERVLMRALEKARIPFVHHANFRRWEIDFLVGGRVAVEVDGYIHVQTSVRCKDKQKEKELREAGYSILRLTNDECKYFTKDCIERIKKEIEKHKLNSRLEPVSKELAPWQVTLRDRFLSCDYTCKA